MLGQFTPAYHQSYDLDTQKTAFTNALRDNDRARAQNLYPSLLNTFQSSHQLFLPQLQNFLFAVACAIAPTCQLDSMLYLCNLNHANQRILDLTNDQCITLMRETNDQPTFMYFLATSNLTRQQLAPHLDDMTYAKIQAINNLFEEEEQQQEAVHHGARPRIGALGG